MVTCPKPPRQYCWRRVDKGSGGCKACTGMAGGRRPDREWGVGCPASGRTRAGTGFWPCRALEPQLLPRVAWRILEVDPGDGHGASPFPKVALRTRFWNPASTPAAHLLPPLPRGKWHSPGSAVPTVSRGTSGKSRGLSEPPFPQLRNRKTWRATPRGCREGPVT